MTNSAPIKATLDQFAVLDARTARRRVTGCIDARPMSREF
jgi:hypothetical protein